MGLPFVSVNNTRLFYRLEGKAELPVLMLSHSLGCDSGMWDSQMPALLEHFRVLRFDTRGHGASDVPPGDYSIDMLGRDVLGLSTALDVTRFAFCGISMGGAVGQWLALNAPERIAALVLANTSPQFGTRETWDIRLQAVRQGGMPAVADAGMERFLSPANRASAEGQSLRTVLLATDPAGYAGCCVALRDVNFKDSLGRIKVPTLVIGTDHDPSTPWEGNGDILAREIPAAKAVILHGQHLSNLEQPREFASAVLSFLLKALGLSKTLMPA
ncbi:MAG TPA: 3-oxoadipate enol-lactonase [Candidatus Angelobacter sp.]|nr:3-oxoadipate enol-lactonase [Candidatus Angelobacter sp.]